MKKTVLVFILMAGAATVFAQSFTVQNVSGRVEQETSGGTWKAVKSGDTLSGETVIRTGIGARLILVSDGRTFSVAAVQSGKLGALAANTAGIRIDGRVVQTDTKAVNRTTGRISTASARASDAAAEEDIAAE